MDKLPMCRICLTEDVQMRIIANTYYQEIYQRLTMMPFDTKDSRPIQACYICCARLRNCYELRKNCLQSEELFSQMLKINAPNLDELLGSITKKRLTVVHSVVQLNMGHEFEPSWGSEDKTEITETVQIKIEHEEVEGDGNANLDENDPLEDTKDLIKDEIDTSVSELKVQPMVLPPLPPLTPKKKILRSPPNLRSSSATVQQSNSHQALSTLRRAGAVFAPRTAAALVEEPADSPKKIQLKRKLDALVKSRTFAEEKHALEMDILRLQNKREIETLKQKLIQIQQAQIDSEIRCKKMRKIND